MGRRRHLFSTTKGSTADVVNFFRWDIHVLEGFHRKLHRRPLPVLYRHPGPRTRTSGPTDWEGEYRPLAVCARGRNSLLSTALKRSWHCMEPTPLDTYTRVAEKTEKPDIRFGRN